MQMNRVELAGALVRDPTLTALPSGMFVCNFTLAIDDTHWSAEERKKVVKTNYLGCVAWGDLAEYVGGQFKRGDEIYVLGTLEQQPANPEAGRKDSKTKVRAGVVRPIRVRKPGTPTEPGNGSEQESWEPEAPAF